MNGGFSIYTMMQACRETDMTYQALKFYCNQGLVPNVKRDQNNRRVFDEHDIKWIKDLMCLKRCGMSIQEMKEYLALCLEGPSTIPQRKVLLEKKQQALRESIRELEDSVACSAITSPRWSPTSTTRCWQASGPM